MAAARTSAGRVRDEIRAPAAIALMAVSLLVLVATVVVFGRKFEFVDLQVYIGGARALHEGARLYEQTFAQYHLPFTYPPAAAFAFQLLRLGPLLVVGLTWTALSVAALFGLCLIGYRGDLPRRPLSGAWVPALTICAVALWLEPVQNTLAYGQINLILDLLVIVDLCDYLPRLPRGVLVGVAAAVKLIPLFFVVYLVVIGRRRAAGTALSTFGALSILAWVAAPGASNQFWTHAVLAPNRIGSPIFVGDQSLRGLVLRAVKDEHSRLGGVLWLIGAVVVGVLGLVVARRVYERSGAVAGALVAAGTSLLVAPSSWSHYYVWVAPALAFTVSVRRQLSRVAVGVIAAYMALFYAQPIWWLPHAHQAELRWGAVQQLVGSSYVIATVLVLAGVLIASASNGWRGSPRAQ